MCTAGTIVTGTGRRWLWVDVGIRTRGQLGHAGGARGEAWRWIGSDSWRHTGCSIWHASGWGAHVYTQWSSSLAHRLISRDSHSSGVAIVRDCGTAPSSFRSDGDSFSGCTYLDGHKCS